MLSPAHLEPHHHHHHRHRLMLPACSLLLTGYHTLQHRTQFVFVHDDKGANVAQYSEVMSTNDDVNKR
eukprot:751369-Hanusia_phi.AAC.1